jgi:hypothetical protein
VTGPSRRQQVQQQWSQWAAVAIVSHMRSSKTLNHKDDTIQVSDNQARQVVHGHGLSVSRNRCSHALQLACRRRPYTHAARPEVTEGYLKFIIPLKPVQLADRRNMPCVESDCCGLGRLAILICIVRKQGILETNACCCMLRSEGRHAVGRDFPGWPRPLCPSRSTQDLWEVHSK